MEAKKDKKRKKDEVPKRRIIIAAVCVGSLCLLMLIGGLVYVTRRIYGSRPHIVVYKNEYPIGGIDVSSHNGVIDFRRVVADSITFVYIKASEGSDFRDSKFSVNCDSAANAGLKVGAYHFFRKNGNGKLQAANFIDAIAGRRLDLPLVIDVEDWGNESADNEAVVKRNLRDMVASLDSCGYRVMIYTNKDGYSSYIKDDFSHFDLWLCTFKHPRKVVGYNWKILQYSHWGVVDGINGDVDLNVFNGDSLQWKAWLEQ